MKRGDGRTAPAEGASGLRRQARQKRAHGWSRASDRSRAKDDELSAWRGPRSAPPGTALLMLVIVALLTSVGVARVHMRTRVLELGAEITDLTAEQARLLDRKRRLEAERAYLRHPDQLGDIAAERMHMVPVEPERVQKIEVKPGERG